MNIKFMLTVILYEILINSSKSCIDLLNGNSEMTVEERAERAELVLIVEIIKKNPQLSKMKWYSVQAKLFDVLKGLNDNSMNQRILGSGVNITHDLKDVYIDGLGKFINCLSDVEVGGIYLVFAQFRIDGNIWASYFSSFGAAELLNDDVYRRVVRVLGINLWSQWSKCPKLCGQSIQFQTRTLLMGQKPDYSWSIRSRICNWEECSKFIITDVKDGDFSIAPSFLATHKSLLFNCKFKSTSTTSISIKFFTSSKLLLTIEISSNSKIKILSEFPIAIIHHFKFPILNGFGVWENGADFNLIVAIDKTQVALYYGCSKLEIKNLDKILSSLWEISDLKINWTKSNSTSVRLSYESSSRYEYKFCENRNLTRPTVVSMSTESVQWTEWSSCSVSCGQGIMTRHKICRRISECSKDSTLQETSPCILSKCPITDNKCQTTQCYNNAICQAGICYCQNGYSGVSCQLPVCLHPCLNGGKCIKPNSCACPAGFIGDQCQQIECQIQCLNGGQCLTPNKCICNQGYSGDRCEKHVCVKQCENGGQCTKGNKCKCRSGTFGHRCQNFECYPQCMNGGVCNSNNKCRCPWGYFGSFCEMYICFGCQNGGKCIGNTCSCPSGFYGNKCQYQHCITSLKFEKIIKPVIVPFPIIESQKMCQNSECKAIIPQRTVIVNKVIFKPFIGCL